MSASALVAVLSDAGCVAAEEEADELVAASEGDPELLRSMVRRRVAGEPLAWVTGAIDFAGVRLRIQAGVYVPRCQTALLVREAAAVLRPGGVVVDLCTGSGAVAAALGAARPDARVVGTDIDAAACLCAADNGVEVHRGDLDAALPESFRGATDVVTAVAPYVPSDAIAFLPSDFRDHEPLRALDGGPDGLSLLVDVVAAGARLLRPGGWILLELGAGQDIALAPVLARHGFGRALPILDDDGDLRGLSALLL